VNDQLSQKYIKMAIKLAIEHSKDGLNGPFGAVIIHKDRLVAQSWNRVTELNDPTAHAEIMAIRAACQALNRHDLKDCKLFSSCYPCPMCLAAAYWAGIETVYYAATESDAEKAGFIDKSLYREICLADQDKEIQLLRIERPESTQPFERWQENPNRMMY
jgi:guanine deaminase